jgi:tetratricopeptide (TPR) repeat protein
VTGRRLVAVVAIGVAAVAFAAFLPTLASDFVDWDDHDVLVENEHFRGLGPEQLRWMLTTNHWGHYQPVTWLTYGADFVIWGMNPLGYHLTNNLFHAANAVLVFLVAMRLLGSALALPARRPAPDAGAAPPGIVLASALVALFFGLHPLRVESVAWATERRDLVSAFFLLLTILAYLRAAASARPARWLAAALALYLLSMLSKVGGAPLPIVLLVLDWHPLRRLPADPRRWLAGPALRALLEKIPFLAIAIGFAIVTITQQEDRWLIPWDVHDFQSRTAQALYGLAFYAWKTLWPAGLLPLYEIHYPLRLTDPAMMAAAIAVLAWAAAAIALARRWPAILAAILCYGATIGPLLGYFQNGPQIVADRYSYLSTLGIPLLLAGAVLAIHARGRLAPRARGAVLAAAALVLVVLGALTWRQCLVWRDSKALWGYLVERAPDSSFANNSYGSLLQGEGRAEEALPYLRASVAIDERNRNAWLNLWNALEDLGRDGEFVEACEAALDVPDGYIRAGALYRLGNRAYAAGEFERAAELFGRSASFQDAASRDAYPGARRALALALARSGRFADAIPHFERAIALEQEPIQSKIDLALTLDRAGRRSDAIAVLRAVLAEDPANETARRRLEALTGS